MIGINLHDCGRQAEFARAVVTRILDGSARRPMVRYCGYFRQSQKDVLAALEDIVYSNWDVSDSAPPKTRPVEAIPDPSFSLLTWANGSVSFPDSVFQKFSEGTPGHADVVEMKKKLEAEFPNAVAPTPGSNSNSRPGTRARAAGRPDFSIDGGRRPLDFTRLLDKAHVPQSSFTLQRQGGSKIARSLEKQTS